MLPHFKTMGHFFMLQIFLLESTLFFEMNEKLALLMSKHRTYTQVFMKYTTPIKKDAPSGTAISSAEGIIKNTKNIRDGHNRMSLENQDN